MSANAKRKELFENKPVLSAIMELALPSVIGQIILVIYNMADTFFVGLADESVADTMITSVTVCMPAFMFLSAISNLFGVGGASVISRALGQKDRAKAMRASAFAIYGCLAVTALYSLGAFVFMGDFVRLLGGHDPRVNDNACRYMLVAIVAGGVPTAMNTLFSHLFRAEGRSLSASAGIAIGSLLNIALDPLFMFLILPPGNEALGAAIATAISNVVAFFYFIIVLRRRYGEMVIRANPSKTMFGDSIPKDVITVGIPACLMTLCENISYAFLDNLMYWAGHNTVVNGIRLGVEAQAGIGVAKKVNMLAHSVVRGMTQGVLPLIGYNYASGNRRRMEAVLYTSAAMSVGVALLCMTANLLIPYQLTGIFIQDPGFSRDFATGFLMILCVGAPFSAVAYTVISFFQATGHAGNSLILALLRKGILDIPMMFILRALIPVYGLVWATPIADILCCVTAIVLFVSFIARHRRELSVPHPEGLASAE